ncbi:hypothetical protein [Alloactinosynnema sp. L-07]|uniref:hypothetical protein n=1 Tax=Alloactinosynnema sp. L-07 TaxID=1653480 RepID=UPI0006B4D1B9|nr:hypothetical protein [Alloactinosynnema sp. L-07]
MKVWILFQIEVKNALIALEISRSSGPGLLEQVSQLVRGLFDRAGGLGRVRVRLRLPGEARRQRQLGAGDVVRGLGSHQCLEFGVGGLDFGAAHSRGHANRHVE